MRVEYVLVEKFHFQIFSYKIRFNEITLCMLSCSLWLAFLAQSCRNNFTKELPREKIWTWRQFLHGLTWFSQVTQAHWEPFLNSKTGFPQATAMMKLKHSIKINIVPFLSLRFCLHASWNLDLPRPTSKIVRYVCETSSNSLCAVWRWQTVSLGIHHTAALNWLSFVGIHVPLLLFALLTYSQYISIRESFMLHSIVQKDLEVLTILSSPICWHRHSLFSLHRSEMSCACLRGCIACETLAFRPHPYGYNIVKAAVDSKQIINCS